LAVTRSDLGREAGRPERLALLCFAPAESMTGAVCGRACLRIIVDVVARRPSLRERVDAERRRYLSVLTVAIPRVYPGLIM
jgi:hypothetical protein